MLGERDLKRKSLLYRKALLRLIKASGAGIPVVTSPV
jgi:hypothetical protein